MCPQEVGIECVAPSPGSPGSGLAEGLHHSKVWEKERSGWGGGEGQDTSTLTHLDALWEPGERGFN